MSTNSSKVDLALRVYNSPENTLSLYKVAQACEAPYATVKRRHDGTRTASEYNQSRQLLTQRQELVLEAHILFLSQMKCPPKPDYVCKLAGKIISTSGYIPTNKWLDAFIRRSTFLIKNRNKHIDSPRIREGGEALITLFFDLLRYYIEKFEVQPHNIWNLDEVGFKIGETALNQFVVTSRDAQYSQSNDSSELVTVLEVISAAGEVGDPLFIYKGEFLMRSWFPHHVDQVAFGATSQSAFINHQVFFNWFEACPLWATTDTMKWKILLLDGHTSHTTEKFFNLAIARKIIPLFYPSHLTHILQPLDRACFGMAKQHYRAAVAEKFLSGLSPTKSTFFSTYLALRRDVYSSRVIKGGFSMTGIYPVNHSTALGVFQQFMNRRPTSQVDPTPDEEDPVDPESPTNTSRPPTWQSQRMVLMNMKTPSRAIEMFKEVWNERKEASATVVLLQERVARLENQLAESVRKQNRKRPRLSHPNNRVVRLMEEVNNDPSCPLVNQAPDEGFS